ncbi:unnamed protein product, partial [Acanthocheilonema viteae]
MKECIGEEDHYRIFPPRQYSFDEQCDLIEMDGDELAYCLCRRNFCNMKNIIDQFIDFEENHPEIFVTTSVDAIINDKKDERFPISLHSYPAQLNYQSIGNTHQKETNINYGTLKSVRSYESSNDNNIGENNSEYVNSRSTSHQIHGIPRLSHHISNFPSRQSYDSIMFAGNIVPNISVRRNKHSERMNKTTEKFTAPQQITTFLESERQNI